MHLDNALKSLFWWLAYILVALLILCMMPLCSQAAIPQHKNSLGVVIEYSNPNMYMYASIVDGVIMQDETTKRYATSVRFQPSHTFSLYSESVLFCGDAREAFNGKRGPIVVTYERVAHISFKEVGCHNLVSVDEVASKDSVTW
jgi:hypothetical protein